MNGRQGDFITLVDRQKSVLVRQKKSECFRINVPVDLPKISQMCVFDTTKPVRCGSSACKLCTFFRVFVHNDDIPVRMARHRSKNHAKWTACTDRLVQRVSSYMGHKTDMKVRSQLQLVIFAQTLSYSDSSSGKQWKGKILVWIHADISPNNWVLDVDKSSVTKVLHKGG